MTGRIVIDANLVFSELIAGKRRLWKLFSGHPDWEFYCPKYVLVELFKHKERIAAASGLDEENLLALLHAILEHIRFFDEDAIVALQEEKPRRG